MDSLNRPRFSEIAIDLNLIQWDAEFYWSFVSDRIQFLDVRLSNSSNSRRIFPDVIVYILFH